ncbi:MAG: hypothetical protein OEX81_03510 [Candidatus Pacebacteria bacterium]|nr:hypothetical protein [Candidatus Paceibacterota bacterium]
MNYPQYHKQPFRTIDLYSQAMADQFKITSQNASFGEEFWNNCDNVLELGAGQGIIALALFRLVNESCKIHTLDIEVPLHRQVIKTLGSQLESNLNLTITEFLSKNPHAIFDLITLVNVGSNHGINEASLLSNVMQPGGVVLDCMTDLSEKVMTPTFELIEAKGNKLWVLK